MSCQNFIGISWMATTMCILNISGNNTKTDWLELFIFNTVNSLKMDALVSSSTHEHFFLFFFLPATQNLYLHLHILHTFKWTLFVKHSRTQLKLKIGFFFGLCCLINGHPMNNN